MVFCGIDTHTYIHMHVHLRTHISPLSYLDLPSSYTPPSDDKASIHSGGVRRSFSIVRADKENAYIDLQEKKKPSFKIDYLKDNHTVRIHTC